MRAHWAKMQNAALETPESFERIDRRSLEAQREEAEQERDKLQAHVTELESMIDGQPTARRGSLGSVYEAAWEALLFGVESPTQPVEVQHSPSPSEGEPVRGLAIMKARQRERRRERDREEQLALRRPLSLKESIWDSLDKIGWEKFSPLDRDGLSNAMARI